MAWQAAAAVRAVVGEARPELQAGSDDRGGDGDAVGRERGKVMALTEDRAPHADVQARVRRHDLGGGEPCHGKKSCRTTLDVY